MTEPVEVETVEVEAEAEADPVEAEGGKPKDDETPAGDAVLHDPDGVAHTIVAAGVQSLLALGWTRAD
ncbi:MAG: hypothetical protein Q4F65_01055 [Propionibacteriaceae bacterium]|nr:hypothetical protein [Propionibacteriaceae bacterium]